MITKCYFPFLNYRCLTKFIVEMELSEGGVSFADPQIKMKGVTLFQVSNNYSTLSCTR